jgi:hypothetical protein
MDIMNIYGTMARAISFILFAIILALSLLWTESLYSKLSGRNNHKFGFNNLKLKKNS